ncbi:MAG TPA: hypothetical protein PL064_05920 [Thermogutta sp.]|nr:hypothetical protein [Thermogutta sp.]HPZ82949.1 hypothetical protein [Thermogutta sp.]HQF15221.1 hypothetical protein [Thermogutta sp.]
MRPRCFSYVLTDRHIVQLPFISKIAGLMAAVIAVGFLWFGDLATASEPAAINPFGPPVSEREDAVPGYVELSDGKIIAGKVYMTRDKRVKVFDSTLQRQREIPLNRIKQIECIVVSERMEKEWRFRETTSNVKEYTGRSYPTREYLHRITLDDGRTIEGPLSEVIYVQPEPSGSSSRGQQAAIEPQRFILYKTHKGPVGSDLKSLVYVKVVKLGEEALAEGQKKGSHSTSSRTTSQEASESKSRP